MVKKILQGKVECSRLRGCPKKIECRILLCELRRRYMIETGGTNIFLFML